nr:MAG TPA: hypothetical protein [Caudoviricetes sp.]
MYVIGVSIVDSLEFICFKNAYFRLYAFVDISHIIISGSLYRHHTRDLNECFIDKYSQYICFYAGIII